MRHRKSHGRSLPKTDFTRYTHPQLYTMLHSGEEETVRGAADSWDGVGARLHEQAGNLEVKLARFRERWQGGAAEQYQIMINDLAGGLRRIGDAAFAVRDIAHDTADALATAKVEMPAPVAVPDISPTTVHLATAQLEVDATASAAAVARLRQQQADAVADVQAYQQATQQANAAHAKAVAVMNQLAGEYRRADTSIPRTGVAEPAPPVPGSGHPGEVPGMDLTEDDLLPDDLGTLPEEAKPKPVFGNMFTAGLAAASAAAAGRLGMPRIPPWAAKKDPTAGKKDDAKEKGVAKLTGGGGVGKFGGGGGIGGAPVPTAHGGMLGAGPATGVGVTGLGAVAAAAGAGGAAGTGGAMPMMPFMPFAPTGFDMAGARRVPPWLVETEEVWGESSIITPPVIGEDPPDRPDPSAGYRY